ncbi:N-acetylmuramidase domain-containing protein [Chelativorans sp. Marseille-P2723]|uniref:N-acetylmuramidase domain-containing protein n=1 Tax=Chelativorans sp. Marseille-P2723 TaxID=2709133 RepID=UPI00156DC374|nr:N-acetylmuramidase domain-containing protein [Chelativorans sp. Marseille-P2723]
MIPTETAALISHLALKARLEPATLLAVVEVESAGRTHAVVDGRKEPLIRFEGHYFDRRLSPEKREAARRAGLAAPTAGTIRNPTAQPARWHMLERAAEIDKAAAYEATSWGVGQVMGAHWAWLGYGSIEALVEEARSGLDGQLRLMMRYIEKAGLAEALRRRDWTAFARGYNGPAYARNGYHLRLSLAYRRYARTESSVTKVDQPSVLLRSGDRGENVRHLQGLLCALGHPVVQDGIFGPETRGAVLTFQRRHGLAADGIVGPLTWTAINDNLPAKRIMHLIHDLGRRIRQGAAALLMRWGI